MRGLFDTLIEMTTTAPKLPSTTSDFASVEYWDDAFAANEAPFEWYGAPSDLLPLFPTTTLGKTLVLGCGNSSLSHDLHVRGLTTQLVSLDFSQVVIDQMRAKHPQMEWVKADMLALPASFAGRFDSIIDKGALDALIPDDANNLVANTLFAQVKFALSSTTTNGTYFLVSLLQAHVLTSILNSLFAVITISPFDPASGSNLQPFLVCLSGAVTSAISTSITVAGVPHNSNTAMQAVRELQQSYTVRMALAKPSSIPRRATFVLANAQGEDMYHLSIIDTNQPNSMPYACLILPLGREVTSEEAQMEIAKSNKIGRLVIVSLLGERIAANTNTATVQRELSPIMLQLKPIGLASEYSIPFLAMGGDDLGQRVIVAKYSSALSGEFVVEDVTQAHEPAKRRLVFSANALEVQSEVQLNEQGEPDLSVLVFELHRAMVSAWRSMCAEQSPPGGQVLAVIGLGGGNLASYLRQRSSAVDSVIHAVEWDAEVVRAAETWFGFARDKFSVFVGDGLEYLGSGMLANADAIFIDVNGGSEGASMQFPPPGFVSPESLELYKTRVLKPGGLLVVNFCARQRHARLELLKRVKKVFQRVYAFVLSEFGDANVVLCAYNRADAVRMNVVEEGDDDSMHDALFEVGLDGECVPVLISAAETKKKKKKKKKR
jgi:SAM-dependent methyltransferase